MPCVVPRLFLWFIVVRFTQVFSVSIYFLCAVMLSLFRNHFSASTVPFATQSTICFLSFPLRLIAVISISLFVCSMFTFFFLFVHVLHFSSMSVLSFLFLSSLFSSFKQFALFNLHGYIFFSSFFIPSSPLFREGKMKDSAPESKSL